MTQQYYALVSYTPLSAQQVDRLHSIGVIAPYDQANEKFNIYIYAPVEAYLDLKPKIEAITQFYAINTPIPLEQIQKQLSKIDEVNKVKIGDTVYCKGYKKLPFTVNNVTETTAHIFHTLKRSNIVLEVQLRDIYPVAEETDTPQYTRRIPTTPENKIYLDFDNYRITDRNLLNQTILRDLINIKLAMLDRKIVLLNPILKQDDLINNLGLEIHYQTIGNINGDIVTDTPLITAHYTYRLDYNTLEPYKCTPKERFLFMYQAKRKTKNKALEVWNRAINNEHPYSKIVNDTLMSSYEWDTEPTIIPEQEVSTQEVESIMIRQGLANIHAKTEDILYLLKGQL